MANPWDKNAERRHNQILDGMDFSFSNVLAPSLLKHIGKIPNIGTARVLDIGCGSGILSQMVAKYVGSIIGIDPSRSSVEIARRDYGKVENLKFFCQTIAGFQTSEEFDLIISNMTFQAIRQIGPAFKSVSNLMTSDGIFLFAIPHPCFWASYRKRISPSDFKDYIYMKDSIHKITFSISRDRKPLPSLVPYYHRSLETYTLQLNRANLRINRLIEPFSRRPVEEEIRQNWDIPHFLIFECSKA